MYEMYQLMKSGVIAKISLCYISTALSNVTFSCHIKLHDS